MKKYVPVATAFALVLMFAVTIPTAYAACKPPVDFTLSAVPKDCNHKQSVFERIFAMFNSFA